MGEELGLRRAPGRSDRGRMLGNAQVLEDGPHDTRVGEEGEDALLTVAGGAAQWVDLVDAGEELGPAAAAGRGLVDGTLLAATLLGTILTVGSLATALAEHTPAFALLGRPLVPALQILGLPDAEQIAPAILAGITEMYVPALLVEGASAPARFFVCVLSISQLIFFSSVGPMMLDLFKDVPIRVRDLLLIFLLRTVILVPTLALWTLCLTSIGVFEGR